MPDVNRPALSVPHLAGTAQRKVVPRPDREGEGPMTCWASLRLRKIFKMLAVELDTTMNDLGEVAYHR